jgi:hypothetical protein
MSKNAKIRWYLISTLNRHFITVIWENKYFIEREICLIKLTTFY